MAPRCREVGVGGEPASQKFGDHVLELPVLTHGAQLDGSDEVIGKLDRRLYGIPAYQ